MYQPILIDEAITPKHYADLEDDELLVTSIFGTIQGEGPYAGERAMFLRLSGCQYGGKGVNGPGCKFCDTDFRFKHGQVYTISYLIEKIEENHPGHMAGSKMRLLVITGGEPTLQDNLLEFVCQVEHRLPDVKMQIESNGLRHLPLPDFVYLVVSPKVPERPNTIMARYAAISKGVLERADCLKILVSADEKSPYHYLPSYLDYFQTEGPLRPIYLSPINVYRERPMASCASIWDSRVIDQAASARNHAFAAELCIKYGYCLSVQQHLFAAVP